MPVPTPSRGDTYFGGDMVGATAADLPEAFLLSLRGARIACGGTEGQGGSLGTQFCPSAVTPKQITAVTAKPGARKLVLEENTTL